MTEAAEVSAQGVGARAAPHNSLGFALKVKLFQGDTGGHNRRSEWQEGETRRAEVNTEK